VKEVKEKEEASRRKFLRCIVAVRRVPGGLDVEVRGLGGEAGGLEVVEGLGGVRGSLKTMGGLGIVDLGVAVGGLRLVRVAGSSEVLVGGLGVVGRFGGGSGRLQWPRGLRRRSAAARPLRLWGSNPTGWHGCLL